MSDVSSLRLLVPLPKNAWEGCCALCDKPQSRWTVRGSPGATVCAMCLLYDSAWGKRNAASIEATIADIQKARGVELLRQGDRLFRCDDADSVLGVLVLVDRTLARMPT